MAEALFGLPSYIGDVQLTSSDSVDDLEAGYFIRTSQVYMGRINTVKWLKRYSSCPITFVSLGRGPRSSLDVFPCVHAGAVAVVLSRALVGTVQVRTDMETALREGR